MYTLISKNERPIATNDLLERWEKTGKKAPAINVAYTDYGGNFFDKVVIEYFFKKYPDNIIWEHTMYNGKNAIIFGDIVSEFIEATESYPLGFEDIESLFFEMEFDEKMNGFDYFKQWELENKFELCDEDAAREIFDNYCSVITSGCDYSTDKILEVMMREDVISKIEEEI
jgi:hypothetical protein